MTVSILVVDDEPDVADLFRQRAAEQHCRCNRHRHATERSAHRHSQSHLHRQHQPYRRP